MYIRRKVFSLLQDENGEERYFSTTEFTDERLYSDEGIEMLNKMRKGAGLKEQVDRAEYMKSEAQNRAKEAAEKAKEAGQSERLSKAGRQGANLSRKGAGMEKIDSPAVETTKKVAGKAKDWAKKTYGKGAQHRGRNIAITAAVPVVATGGVIVGKKIAKNRKAKRAED